MEILYRTNKGKLMDTIENYHIHKETQQNNQINDRNTIKSNIIFDMIVQANANRVRTARKTWHTVQRPVSTHRLPGTHDPPPAPKSKYYYTLPKWYTYCNIHIISKVSHSFPNSSINRSYRDHAKQHNTVPDDKYTYPVMDSQWFAWFTRQSYSTHRTSIRSAEYNEIPNLKNVNFCGNKNQ
jgi:hypothetical protein